MVVIFGDRSTVSGANSREDTAELAELVEIAAALVPEWCGPVAFP
jgi:hypothetical protein